MKEATLVYPHQLFQDTPSLVANREVYLVEESLLLTEFPTHVQKLLLHRLSMRNYQKELQDKGLKVHYCSVIDYPDTESVFKKIANDKVATLHIVDTTDLWLEKRINSLSQKYKIKLVRYESPLFILSKSESIKRYDDSGKNMARFYKRIRLDNSLLIDSGKKPLGGAWSFDKENRKSLPKNLELPLDIAYAASNEEIDEALLWLSTLPGEHYGSQNVWVPWTRPAARRYLDEFLKDRLINFGNYEDAIAKNQVRLFHSGLSSLINIGLLSPMEVVEKVIEFGTLNQVSINNIEGFVRQVIGWREFIRASYECDGSRMRTTNFWNFSKPLPKSFWKATTNILPIDLAIQSALDNGYNHHIERLMVIGNFMLLSEFKPDDVYRWFMSMYVDAYDWVMVPNVYGMSQFADGGIFATKPYISGGNYLKKMSDYPAGDWEDLWTALYWRFIEIHSDFFKSNHRLSMMPRLLENMAVDRRKYYQQVAKEYLDS